LGIAGKPSATPKFWDECTRKYDSVMKDITAEIVSTIGARPAETIVLILND
jgi:hypothetical protein